MINKNSKIFVVGHKGMVGSAILRKLKELKYKKIFYQTRNQLNLIDQSKVYKYLNKIKPDAVILAAAKVGGIKANNEKKAEFIFDNLSIQNNVIDSSFRCGVKNLIFLGSSCVYPKNSKIPIKEKYLLSNYLEKTNKPYAIAKIAGINLCESYNYQYGVNYKCLMPCNAYGINDNYDPDGSHFLPALIRKIIDALKSNKEFIKIWGSGKPMRELIFSDDVADACIYFLNKKTDHILINIGSGVEKNINDYAKYIMKHLGVKLKIKHEKTNLDGTYRKLMDSSLAKKYGWKYKTDLDTGLAITINDYLEKKIFSKKNK
jgi:GDP-L-fucose synthase